MRFPEIGALPLDFIWGVSTSAFQIEGATREDGRGLSVWDKSGQRGSSDRRDTGDIACDHYHRYLEDTALMRQLGVQAYRFSVAWPRILPTGRGSPNEAGLAFYDRLIDALSSAGIEPWLCLYHWDMPQALADLGGWATRDCVEWFAEYAALVAGRYGDRVKRFATMNEPSIFTLFAHAFAGGENDEANINALHREVHNVNLAHGAAVDTVRAVVPDSLVGAIHNYQICMPCTPADVEAARRCDAYWNQAFPDPQCHGRYPDLMRAAMEPHIRVGDLQRIHRALDWFGVNHYGPVYVSSDPKRPLGFRIGEQRPNVPVTPMGWPIDPNAFRDTLLTVSKRYRLPIYVLENGFGGHDTLDECGAVSDDDRIAYLAAYIEAMNDAARAGADVRGYFVWSLLDNFEWELGYSVRFGLTYVDYPSQKRLPKASFHWYRDLITAARERTDK